MKIISIHQPHYHPWLGLLDKIANSHEHIVLDDVQFRKRNFQNRAQYSTTQGCKLLTLPVQAKGHQQADLKIHDVEIAPQNLQKQYLTLKHRYGKTEGWKDIADALAAIYYTPYCKLADINLALLELSLELFDIRTPIIKASNLQSQGQKNQKLIELCIERNATHYLSGNGAKKYMDDALFGKHGLNVLYQEFQHPIYEQNTGYDFQAGCFALDWYCLQPEHAKAFFYARQPAVPNLDLRYQCA